MAQPTLHVYMGAAYDGGTATSIFSEPSSWTEITEDVRAISWQRGRQRDLDEVAVGTGSMTLRNQSRDYDPTNQSGPHFPLSQRQVKVEAVLSSVTYPLFRGWTANWHVQWDAGWADSYAETNVDLVDGIALLQAFSTFVAAGDDSISARIGEVLNTVEWPAGLRSLTGGSQVQAPTELVRVWDHIQDCVRSDTSMNVCYIDGGGTVTFGTASDTGITFGDGGGSELMYTATGLDYGLELVYTDVTVTRDGGTPQQVVLRNAFGNRTYDRQTLNTSDADALTLAQNILSAYKSPKARPEPMKVRPGNSTDLWTQVLDLELERRIQFIHRPPGGGDAFSQEMKVVGLEHNGNLLNGIGDWTATYRLEGSTLHFPVPGILDNFNRADSGVPMTGWTTLFDSGLKTLSSQCAPNDSGGNDAYYSTAMTSADVDVYVTMAVQPAAASYSSSFRIFGRLNVAGAGSDWYSVIHYALSGTDEIYLERWDNSVLTALAGPYQWNPSAGDGLGLRCRGDQIEAWVRISGVWRRVLAVTDATYDGTGSNNKVALSINGGGISTVARAEDFGGGPC